MKTWAAYLLVVPVLILAGLIRWSLHSRGTR